MIKTIGYEGPNRVGKGTQIELTSRYLEERGVPYVVLRGSGSRTASGETIGDQKSPWWENINSRLKTTADLNAWDEASVRLAREYILWRDYILPRVLKRNGQGCGVILVDRTILSRFMLIRERGDFDSRNLYPEWAKSAGRRIDADLVCPDVILNLYAPKEELLKRLDVTDPKYDFRKLLITKKAEWFSDSVILLPVHIQNRITKITSVGDPEAVFHQIRTVLCDLLSGVGHSN